MTHIGWIIIPVIIFCILAVMWTAWCLKETDADRVNKLQANPMEKKMDPQKTGKRHDD